MNKLWLIKLAWKNMWRNKGRSLITIAAIYFAVILSVMTTSIKTGIFDNLVRNVVSFHSGYIQVHKSGYWDEQILENCFEMSAGIENKALGSKNVTAITARLESFSLAASQDITRGCMLLGVQPETEDKITALRSKLVSGSFLNQADTAVLLSKGLLNRLGMTLNDTLVLISQGYHGATAAGKYRVKGILQFGSPVLNENTVIMPLALAQDFFSAPGMATAYVLSVRNPGNADETASLLQGEVGRAYEVMTWGQMMPEIKQHIETDSNNLRIVQGILYLLISFGIFGTLLMLMVERRFEMGMLLAVGMSKLKLSLLMLTESVFTVLIGCLFGLLSSVPVVVYLNRKPIRIGGETAKVYERFGFEAVFPTSTAPEIFYSQAVVVLLIGLLLSLYPVWVTMRLNPVSAMKK